MSEIKSSPQQLPPKASLREMVTNALRYWEPRRLLYNAVLAFIVIGYFCGSLPESRAALSFDGFLFVFILAVLANLCYCAAYFADIFAQWELQTCGTSHLLNRLSLEAESSQLINTTVEVHTALRELH